MTIPVFISKSRDTVNHMLPTKYDVKDFCGMLMLTTLVVTVGIVITRFFQ